jgi:hypothetical protein
MTADPRTELRHFPRNTRLYAEHWLRTGTRHPEEHWVIAAKLDGWAARVDTDLRAALLAAIEEVAA